MKIAIIGRSEILYDTAVKLWQDGYQIAIIVTSKEAPEYKVTVQEFKELAKKINAKFINTAKINNLENIEILKSCGNIDIGISINYVNVISQDVLNVFPLGILNAHGGDLPKYRGNACQAWAILNGEEKIGFCIHKMEGEELDSGDIIEREYMSISNSTKIGDVYKWARKKIPSLFTNALKKLSQDRLYILEKQSNDNKDILRCYPRKPEDGLINWRASNIDILRLINASGEPYSGAFCYYKNEKLVIWESELYEDNEIFCGIPGQIVKIHKQKGYVIVLTGKGKLKINDVTYRSIRTTPASFINSLRDRLE